MFLNQKKNLIYIGMLDQMCCIVKDKRGFFRVIKFKGSMVIMKGTKVNYLYM